jgi:lysophospholipase L1-like esterase
VTIRTNLTSIIGRARARNVTVLLCSPGLVPIWGFDDAIEVADVFDELAASYKLPYVPAMGGGVFGRPGSTTDMLHPNATGAWNIEKMVWDKLAPLIGAKP